MKGRRKLRKIIEIGFCLLLLYLLANSASCLEREELKDSSILPYSAKRLLTLERAIEISLANNPQIMQSRYNMEAGEYQMKGAISNLFPKLQISQRYTRIDGNSFRYANIAKDAFEKAFNLPPGTIPPFLFQDTYATNIILDQPIYYGGALRAGLSLARNTEKMTKYSFEDVKQNIILETKKAFFSCLKAREMLSLMKRSVELAEANLKDTQLKMEQGLRSHSDVLRWEVQLANERLNQIEAESNLSLAEVILQNVLGVEFFREYQLSPVSPEYFSWIYSRCQKLVSQDQENLLTLTEKAADYHPMVKIASSDNRVKKSQVDIAKSSFKPQISLNYNFGWRQNNTLALDDYQTWSASLQITIPLFNGFGDIWNLKKSERELQASRQAEKQVRRTVAIQLISAFYKLKSSLARIGVADKGLEQAEENLRIIKDKFNLGMASNIEFIDAQVAQTGSESNQINSRYDLLIAVAEMERALGHPLK